MSYRRNGHNEADNPLFTQPQMYTSIASHEPVLQQYSKQLVSEGVVSQVDAQALEKEYAAQCNAAFDRRINFKEEFSGDLQYHWKGFTKYYSRQGAFKVADTGIELGKLKEWGVFRAAPSPPQLTAAQGRRSPKCRRASRRTRSSSASSPSGRRAWTRA